MLFCGSLCRHVEREASCFISYLCATDQRAQFTAEAFTEVLKDNAMGISMDGKGDWIDNVLVERLWRSIKYDEVNLHAYETPKQPNEALAHYFAFYNARRPHQALDLRTVDAVYSAVGQLNQAA